MTQNNLIKALGKIKIDHTDFDDEGCNRLCSEEINKLMALINQHIQEEKKEIIEKYGHFRNVRPDKKGARGRTLRFYLLPSSEHTEEDGLSDF